MKYFLIVVTMMVMGAGCGKDVTNSQQPLQNPITTSQPECSVQQATNGAIITCLDGSMAAINSAVNILGHTVAATTQQCAAGGYNVIFSYDSAYTGIWSSTEQVAAAFTVCNGTNGQNGTNATPLTVVKFCPGNTTYPSEFNEVGFKIGNSIYAVYSQNDGFMTQLPPGAYTSNAVGSSCNFTVNANGTISN